MKLTKDSKKITIEPETDIDREALVYLAGIIHGGGAPTTAITVKYSIDNQPELKAIVIEEPPAT